LTEEHSETDKETINNFLDSVTVLCFHRRASSELFKTVDSWQKEHCRRV